MLPTTARLAALSLTVACLGALPAPAFAVAFADAPTTSAAPAPVPSAQPTGHRKVLPRAMHGKAALQAVGADLGSVAAENGLSRGHLGEVLAEDETAWLSEEGRLFYQEEAPQEATTTPTTAAATTAAATLPLAQTFTLHSRPGAARTIFLDFDGATVSGTAWNTSKRGPITDGAVTGFDLDLDPATFSSTELSQAQEVWRQVSESYSPFDVDVTTQDPGVDALTRSSTTDQTFGMRVLITSQASVRTQACGTCLGVAYVGTYDNVDPTGTYQPAWVFAYSKSFNPMIIAQAATHETGHTLGLTHDGTATASYYPGTAAWGPVMGSSMSRAVTQFSKGEYAGANNLQDDLAVIQTNGLPLRADDHGSSTAAADQLGKQPAYTATGVIGTRADTDVFAVTLPCTTTLSAGATGIGAQTALDLSLKVVNANGAVVASSSPASTYSGAPPRSAGMDAAVTLTGATGTYYLVVDGVGNGSPSGPGWSDYGSLGQYTLTASGCATDSPTTPPTTPPATESPTTPPTTQPPATQPPVTSPRRPSAPRIGGASSGRRGGPRTAVVRWIVPASTGGATIRGYQVRAFRLGRHSRVLAAYTSGRMSAGARSTQLVLPRGRYVFRVLAWNAVGSSPWSASTSTVSAR